MGKLLDLTEPLFFFFLSHSFIYSAIYNVRNTVLSSFQISTHLIVLISRKVHAINLHFTDEEWEVYPKSPR